MNGVLAQWICGGIVLAMRKGLGVSQDWVAQASGVSRAELSRFERGISSLRDAQLAAVALALSSQAVVVTAADSPDHRASPSSSLPSGGGLKAPLQKNATDPLASHLPRLMRAFEQNRSAAGRRKRRI